MTVVDFNMDQEEGKEKKESAREDRLTFNSKTTKRREHVRNMHMYMYIERVTVVIFCTSMWNIEMLEMIVYIYICIYNIIYIYIIHLFIHLASSRETATLCIASV